MEKTIACPICGEPYVFYPFFAGDQSACPDCRGKARSGGKTTDTIPDQYFPSKSDGTYVGW